MKFTWSLSEIHVITVCTTRDHCLKFTWSPSKIHEITVQNSRDHISKFTWSLCEVHVITVHSSRDDCVIAIAIHVSADLCAKLCKDAGWPPGTKLWIYEVRLAGWKDWAESPLLHSESAYCATVFENREKLEAFGLLEKLDYHDVIGKIP